MQAPSVIKFKLGKKKKTGLIISMLVSLIVGSSTLWYAHAMHSGYGRFILCIFGCFLLLVAFFCISGIYHLHKEQWVAMYISDEGIIDISTGNQIGTVVWKDVENIKIMDDISNLKHKYIVLKVSNPKEYIDREKTRVKQRSLELRLQYYGSPICFSNRALDCSFEELKTAVFEKYEAYKTSQN